LKILLIPIWLENSFDTIIENSIIRNHTRYDPISHNDSKWHRNFGIYVDYSNPQIINSSFENNITGIYTVNNSQAKIKNNKFTQNSYPIFVNNSYSEFSQNQMNQNHWNAIILRTLKIDRDYTLGADSVFVNYEENPYSSIVVEENSILTIKPGTIIKFFYNSSGLVVKGNLKADGSKSEPIVFTSFYDDGWGGDTNSDGNDTEQELKPSAWGQLLFMLDSSNSSLNYVIFRYGGARRMPAPNFYAPDYVLKIDNSSFMPSLSNLIFENNYKNTQSFVDDEENNLEQSPNFGQVEIVNIFYDGIEIDESDEYVEIKNKDTIIYNLENWTLEDRAGHKYTFPVYELNPQDSIKIYTNLGELSFKSSQAIWNNDGDTAKLYDNNQKLVNSFNY